MNVNLASGSTITYRQCVRCVMDTTDLEITFNDKGYCNHCSDFLEKVVKLTYQGEASDKILQQQVSEIKKSGKNKKYDCVVGISGGADSCYTAYVCKQLGLRALLVHVDNGWNAEISVKNIEIICRTLEFDFISYVLDWSEFRDVQLAHLRASVPEIETPTDIAILQYLHQAAAKYDVHSIVMGGNYITEGILPKSWHYDAKDKKYSLAIQKQFGTMPIKNFPAFDYWQEMYYKFIKGIKIYYLLNHLPYNKREVIKKLEGLGWRDYGEKHHESFYTRIVQSYILPLKFNIDYRKATLSNKICNHILSREQALERLSKPAYNVATIESDIEYVCKKLGISTTEFKKMMEEKPKTFKDFPNNKKILDFVYKMYRFISGSK